MHTINKWIYHPDLDSTNTGMRHAHTPISKKTHKNHLEKNVPITAFSPSKCLKSVMHVSSEVSKKCQERLGCPRVSN